MARRGREEMKVIDALSQSTQEIHSLLLQCERHIHDSENRLRQIQSAHLETAGASLRQELSEVNNALNLAESRMIDQIRSEVKNALNLAESRMADQIRSESATSIQKICELTQRVEAEAAQKEKLKEKIAVRLSELGLSTQQTKAALNIQNSRLALLIEASRTRLPNPSIDERLQDMVKNHTDHKFDSLYVAFEDVFRGSREDIKARQSVYLPLLKEHGIGSTAMPILDLGCGRGEWLELLREHGLQAQGLEQNEIMIEQCKFRGLDVIQGDSLSYLGTLPEACMGAVTSFHMVEHLPFEITLTLIDETLRVLKPGGILILETPNPQNVLVASHTFHLDPTHVKPLPSVMLRFFVEARGFCDVQVRELHPYPETVHFPDDGKGVANRLNDYFYGPQDYAVIGRKP
ncbi:MAG: class I SAM-dependent methyltransferase [Acidobacteriota bacterium]|nr:class I SAM-dependent methyltransferase [Acidobacteriota bacterium]